jgi:hypothetical protein
MTSSSVSSVAGRDPRVVFARHGAGEGSNEFQRERNLRLAVCDWFAITPGRIQIHTADGEPRYARDGHPVTRSDGGRQEARQLADRLLATIEAAGQRDRLRAERDELAARLEVYAEAADATRVRIADIVDLAAAIVTGDVPVTLDIDSEDPCCPDVLQAEVERRARPHAGRFTRLRARRAARRRFVA